MGTTSRSDSRLFFARALGTLLGGNAIELPYEPHASATLYYNGLRLVVRCSNCGRMEDLVGIEAVEALKQIGRFLITGEWK